MDQVVDGGERRSVDQPRGGNRHDPPSIDCGHNEDQDGDQGPDDEHDGNRAEILHDIGFERAERGNSYGFEGPIGPSRPVAGVFLKRLFNVSADRGRIHDRR